VEALTPSEARIVRMAADGLANREIAQALFVTARTVETHLTHAYQKLGISSREELPAALAERP
jgi:DNA-binding CsgD family transcriptional regulator